MRLSALFLALTTTLAVFTPAMAQKKAALVIGVNAYAKLGPQAQLQKAVNDARAVAKTLQDLGFDVMSATDVGKNDFDRLWRSFLDKLQPGDTAAFFFAGHGVEIDNNNYLILGDVAPLKANQEEDLKRSSPKVATLIESLNERRTKVRLIILDACRDNPFKQGQARGPGGERGLVREETPEGSFIMFSAEAGKVALDRLPDPDADENSVYTRMLLPLMRQSGLTLSDMAKEVRKQVDQLIQSRGLAQRQRPPYYDEITGDFCLAGGC